MDLYSTFQHLFSGNDEQLTIQEAHNQVLQQQSSSNMNPQNILSAVGSFPDEPAPERKRKHKLTEQRGRQKINNQINDLKQLLPECKYVMTTKASVLECAVNSLRRLQTLCNQLMYSNKNLQKENKRLRAELERLRDAGVLVFPIDEEPQLAENDILSPPEIDSILNGTYQPPTMPPGVGIIPHNMGINLSQMQFSTSQYLSSEYGSSSPASSPHSSPFSPLSPVDSDPFSNQTQYDGLEPTDYDSMQRFTKRRLLMVFLFMLPFFLSLDSFYVASTTPPDTTYHSRVILSVNLADSSSVYYYFDIARLLWYVVGGALGITWMVNTFLWIQAVPKASRPGPNQKHIKTSVVNSTTANFTMPTLRPKGKVVTNTQEQSL